MTSQQPYFRNSEGGLNSMKSNAGFGLIEILVSLLILAIGLLGLASLQATILTQSTETRNRSQAILLADDMFERIRANRNSVASYVVPAADAPACNKSYKISNTDVAADDIAEWQNSLACLLPEGNGTVQVDTNGEVVSIDITWNTNTDDTDDGTLTMEARL